MTAPDLYGCTKCGGANYGCTCATLKDCTVPLYTRAAIDELVAVLKNYDGGNATDEWDQDLMPSRTWEKEKDAAIAKHTKETE